MKIFLLKQSENKWWDIYDSCVVCAENEEEAKSIHPYWRDFIENEQYWDWAYTKEWIICEEIGEANEKQERWVICASFNAG